MVFLQQHTVGELYNVYYVVSRRRASSRLPWGPCPNIYAQRPYSGKKHDRGLPSTHQYTG
jgi:hypothetical protein